MTDTPSNLSRRDLMKLSGLGAAALTLPAVGAKPALAAEKVKTNARIVIIGAGAAGLAAASRLSQQLDGAAIILIDRRKAHYYQPGFTLVAAGLKPENYVTTATADYVRNGGELIEEQAAEIDPDGNKVVTDKGRVVPYDYLIVAAGLHLDYAAINGMEVDKIGKDGLGSVYASPAAAVATAKAMFDFTEKGGVGLFGRPATEMKCAGAPLKYTFIVDDYLRRNGARGKSEIIYAAQNKTLFSVPIVSEKVRMLFRDRGVKVAYDRVMTAIDLSRKVATFKTPDGVEEIKYDFTNVVPPMRAPDVVRNSPLPWRTGQWATEGWMDVDRGSLRHKRYPNVFGVGDIAGVPKGKTAASVKWQVPVAVAHLVGDITGTPSEERYDGYTSCPLITRLGQAMLIEFDYHDNLVPSFPGVIAPLEELWISWVMKTMALKPTYLSMLRGRA